MENQENKIQSSREEIELMDYVKVVIKRWKFILGVFLIIFIVAAVYSFFIAKKIYNVDAVLEIGSVGGVFIEEPTQLAEKINGNLYDIVGRYPAIKINNPDNTKLFLMEIKSAQPEDDKKILKEVIDSILAEHQGKIDVKKKLATKNIELTQNEISVLEDEKKDLISKEKSLEWLSPYQHISEQLSGSLFALFDTREKLSDKNRETNDLYIRLNSMQGALEDIFSTKIMKEPTTSGSPVSPNSILNMKLATVLGVFLGVFLAFGKEWWSKSYAKK
jgi:capsular polysaccharide biosynthesis protein